MLIKKPKYKKVRKTVVQIVSDGVYGCDQCEKELSLEKRYLDLTAFQNSGDTSRNEFCSWVCVLKFLPKVKSDYFVTLPYLSYEGMEKGCRVSDFLALFKEKGK